MGIRLTWLRIMSIAEFHYQRQGSFWLA